MARLRRYRVSSGPSERSLSPAEFDSFLFIKAKFVMTYARAYTTVGGASATYGGGRQRDGEAEAKGRIADKGPRRAWVPGSNRARGASSARPRGRARSGARAARARVARAASPAAAAAAEEAAAVSVDVTPADLAAVAVAEPVTVAAAVAAVTTATTTAVAEVVARAPGTRGRPLPNPESVTAPRRKAPVSLAI